MSRAALLSLLLGVVGLLGFAESSAQQAADDMRVQIQRDPDAPITTVRISAPGGRVAWSDVLRALSRVNGFDDSALQSLSTDESFSLRKKRTRLQFAAYNLVLGPHLRFQVQRGEPGEDPTLVITIDHEAVQNSRRLAKNILRDVSLAELSEELPLLIDRKEYGLLLDRGWEKQAPRQPLVIGVHGLNSSADRMLNLLSVPRTAGLATGVFQYPNDQPVKDSAELLASGLREIAERQPERRVTLLTHSMGGLVARAVIENESLDPGNVTRLIMIAPPNQGSELAHCNLGADVWEGLASGTIDEPAQFLYMSIRDGLSEAAHDLRPGSPFLLRLNRRPRNPKVAYSILLGDGGPLTEQQLQKLHAKVQKTQRRNRLLTFLGGPIDKWLSDLDEVVDGRGDGAVSVERGKLDGVEDEVVFHFGHLKVLQEPTTDNLRAVHEAVLERLTH